MFRKKKKKGHVSSRESSHQSRRLPAAKEPERSPGLAAMLGPLPGYPSRGTTSPPPPRRLSSEKMMGPEPQQPTGLAALLAPLPGYPRREESTAHSHLQATSQYSQAKDPTAPRYIQPDLSEPVRSPGLASLMSPLRQPVPDGYEIHSRRSQSTDQTVGAGTKQRSAPEVIDAYRSQGVLQDVSPPTADNSSPSAFSVLNEPDLIADAKIQVSPTNGPTVILRTLQSAICAGGALFVGSKSHSVSIPVPSITLSEQRLHGFLVGNISFRDMFVVPLARPELLAEVCFILEGLSMRKTLLFICNEVARGDALPVSDLFALFQYMFQRHERGHQGRWISVLSMAAFEGLKTKDLFSSWRNFSNPKESAARTQWLDANGLTELARGPKENLRSHDTFRGMDTAAVKCPKALLKEEFAALLDPSRAYPNARLECGLDSSVIEVNVETLVAGCDVFENLVMDGGPMEARFRQDHVVTLENLSFESARLLSYYCCLQEIPKDRLPSIRTLVSLLVFAEKTNAAPLESALLATLSRVQTKEETFVSQFQSARTSLAESTSRTVILGSWARQRKYTMSELAQLLKQGLQEEKIVRLREENEGWRFRVDQLESLVAALMSRVAELEESRELVLNRLARLESHS